MESPLDYPIGFASLTKHLRDHDVPVARHGADLCAAAVLFAVGHLHPRTMAAIADAVLARSIDATPSRWLSEVAASRDPDRDPNIRSAFLAFLAERALAISADDAWGILARVGVRHASEIVGQMVLGTVDPIDGALEIETCFTHYLPDVERRRLCSGGQHPPLERSRAFEPFVVFTRVSEDLYHAGHNANEWNDQLSHAPSNTMSPDEKTVALAGLRARYRSLARDFVSATIAKRL